MRRPTTVVITALLLSACNGQVYHGASSLDAAGKPITGSGNTKYGLPVEEGIVFYPKIEVLKTTETVKLNKDTGKCDHATAFDILTVSDTSNPQRLFYAPAWLETYKFSATLAADGTLASVGTESTPDQGNTFKNVAAGVSSLATAATSVAGAKFALVSPELQRALEKAAATCVESTNVSFARFDPSTLPVKGLPK